MSESSQLCVQMCNDCVVAIRGTESVSELVQRFIVSSHLCSQQAHVTCTSGNSIDLLRLSNSDTPTSQIAWRNTASNPICVRICRLCSPLYTICKSDPSCRLRCRLLTFDFVRCTANSDRCICSLVSVASSYRTKQATGSRATKEQCSRSESSRHRLLCIGHRSIQQLARAAAS